MSINKTDKRKNVNRALFVGINDYEWAGAQLKGCANDAISLANVFRRNYDGSPNFVCKVMVSDKNNEHKESQDRFSDRFKNIRVKRATLKKEVEELFKGDCDVALFFFAGHGHEDNLGGSLVTCDAVKYDEGVSVSDVLHLANSAMHIREIFIILDCCHSGHMGNIPAIDKAVLRQGISILTASMSHEVARERHGQGVFTGILIEGLNGGAADVTGKVTAASLYNYADNTLGAFDQRPVYKSHVTSLRKLRNAKPKVPDQLIQMIPVFFDNIDYKYPLDRSYEPEVEPHNAENEKKFAILQKYRAAGLVKPSNGEHLYFEAVKKDQKGSCELTKLGQFYWQMVKHDKI